MTNRHCLCPLLLSHPQSALCRAVEDNLAPASPFRDKGVTACTATGTFGNSSDAAIGLELFRGPADRSRRRAIAASLIALLLGSLRALPA